MEGAEALATDGQAEFEAGRGWLCLISSGWVVVRKPGITKDELENEPQDVFSLYFVFYYAVQNVNANIIFKLIKMSRTTAWFGFYVQFITLL